MIITNRNGLSPQELEKVLKPYSRNSGKPVDFERAGAAAVNFLEEHPTLLQEVGELLDKAQN